MVGYKELADKEIEYFVTKRGNQNLFSKVWVENGTFYLRQSTTESDIIGGTTTVPTPTPTPGIQTPAQMRNWPVKFIDTFDQPTPDLTKWGLEMEWDAANNYANKEAQMYDPSCIVIENGKCNIYAIKPSKPLKHWTNDGVDYQYVAGFMHTANSFNFQYGYIEWTGTIPVGKGAFPAGWLLPTPPTDKSKARKWPPEIDQFEGIGEINKIYLNRWYGTGDAAKSDQIVATVNDVTKEHRYGLLWDKDLLVWFVDDVEVARQTKNVPAESMYWIFNVAIGGQGSWAGPPDATTKFPMKMVINDITIRQKA